MYPANPVPFQGSYPPPQGPPAVVVVNAEQQQQQPPPKKHGLLGGDLGNTVIYVFFPSCFVDYSFVFLSLLIQL